VLVLADQECLEDAQMNLIRKFVAGGGAVVATESTSLYNNWRERRRDVGLHDLLGVSAPPFHTIGKGEYFPGNAPLRRQAGAGRVVYIPEVQPAIEKPLGARMTNQYWRLPLNSREIVDAVRWAAGNISIEVTGPNTVVAAPMRPGTTKLLLHLLNYDVARTPSVTNLDVKFRLPKNAAVSKVTLLSPDRAGAAVLPHQVKDGKANLTVPTLATYDLAVIELK